MREIQRSTIPTLAVESRTDHLPLYLHSEDLRQGDAVAVFLFRAAEQKFPLKSNFLVRSDSQNTVR